MPDHPTWLERVPQLLETLQDASSPPFLDRRAVEKLFGVRRRQAIDLLHRFDGYQVGRAFVVPRESILAGLAEIAASGHIETVRAQKQRVEEFLGEAQQGLTLPTIPLPGRRRSNHTFSGLPSSIRFEAGQLTIHFQGATELLEQLLLLSQALTQDFEAFETALAAAPNGTHA